MAACANLVLDAETGERLIDGPIPRRDLQQDADAVFHEWMKAGPVVAGVILIWLLNG